MDATIDAAMSAVYLDDQAAVERWFEFLCGTYEQHADSDWSGLSATLADGAGSAGVDAHVVERFVEFMNANDMAPMETVRQLAEMSAELPAHYYRIWAVADGSGDETGAAHDIGGQPAGGAAQGPDVGSFPEVKHGDSGEWVEYLDAVLTRHGF